MIESIFWIQKHLDSKEVIRVELITGKCVFIDKEDHLLQIDCDALGIEKKLPEGKQLIAVNKNVVAAACTMRKERLMELKK